MHPNQAVQPGDQGFNPFREDLRGRCGIITGAASGIGRAAAFYLARCGAKLALSDVAAAALQSAVGEIESLGVKAPLALEVDVTQEKHVARLVEETVTGLGRIDFLVTSAGILRRTPFLAMKTEEWDLVLGVNLRGVFLCCRAVAAVMAGQKQGAIVNVASLAGRSSSILGGAHYTASKHGVIGLSRHMARELGPQGIRVNAFCPGATYYAHGHRHDRRG